MCPLYAPLWAAAKTSGLADAALIARWHVVLKQYPVDLDCAHESSPAIRFTEAVDDDGLIRVAGS